MKPLEKGFYYNFKHDPLIGIYHFAYFILPYPAGDSESPEIKRGGYLRLYGTPYLWTRPIGMFPEDVSGRADNPMKQKKRFMKIEDKETIQILTEELKEMYPEINPFP